MATATRLISVDFEVFGRVQGVFFRKYTRDTARKYDLVGWVRNTDEGTVTGNVQGPEDKVKKMKKWLSTEGSPKSKIERYEFKNETPIDKTSYSEFTIAGETGVAKKKKKKKATGSQSTKKLPTKKS